MQVPAVEMRMRSSQPFLKVLLILLSFSKRWGGLPRDRPRVVLIKAEDKVNETRKVEIIIKNDA